ncbi:MAG: hypothetical protein GY865_20005 [candidate division Zixibacteria bacterium]|nr:hypothetical protein [candidate division Zixibacteria bacterium]
MSFRVFVALMSILMLFATLAFTANHNNIHAKVFIDTKPQLNQFYAQHLDVAAINNNSFEIVTNKDELNELEAIGFRTEIVIDDIEKFVISRFDPSRTMGGYLTLSEINAAIDVIVADHPTITSKVDIGQSLEGRTMWAIKISDNPNVDEDEPEILFTSTIHAREVITPLVLLNVMDSLTDKYSSDPYIQNLVDERETWFVLNVNPDGYYENELIAPSGGGMWRKNRRDNGDGTYGVDINRNFGYEWGYDDIGSSPDGDDETYRGTAAWSEPETQNMRDFSIAHEFVISVYYHSYSNLYLWPFSYNVSLTEDEDIFIGLGDSACAFTGYTPNYINSLYPVNGGTDDWEYGEQTLKGKTYSFVVEVGTSDDRFWPATNRIQPLVDENYLSTLFLIEVIDSVEQAMVPKPPALIIADTVDLSSYQIDWTHTDAFNKGVNYELYEYSDYSQITDPGDNLDNFDVDGYSIGYSRYHSGYSSFYCGTTPPNYNGSITTKNPIPIKEGDIFRFWTYYRIEDDFDYAYVAVSQDGVSWTNIAGNITTETNPNGSNQGNGITGESGGWLEAEFDMTDYVGQSIYISFRYITDAGIQEEGIYFDDVEMVTVFGTETLVSSSIADTSFAFIDKQEDTDYFYKVRAQDADLQWSQFSPVVATHTSMGYVCGDVDGIVDINILDIVFLINYKYKDGPAPDPIIAGNVNGIEPIDILDIVHLVNFVYKDGDDPNCL